MISWGTMQAQKIKVGPKKYNNRLKLTINLVIKYLIILRRNRRKRERNHQVKRKRRKGHRSNRNRRRNKSQKKRRKRRHHLCTRSNSCLRMNLRRHSKSSSRKMLLQKFTITKFHLKSFCQMKAMMTKMYLMVSKTNKITTTEVKVPGSQM